MNTIAVTLCLLVLSGCSSVLSCDDGREVRWFSSPTEHMLNNGIDSYENGNYATSMSILQRVAENKAASKKQKITAHKYLAFIHCVSAREKQCRDSFKRAFELDADFSLSPAEAGHPVWGPVFSSVKFKPFK
jgi:uncharacterized protein YceK